MTEHGQTGAVKNLISMRRRKPVKRSAILSVIMGKQVIIPVIGTHSKMRRIRGVSLPIDLLDIEFSAAKSRP